VPLSDREAVGRNQVSEEFEARLAASGDVDDGGEPVFILAFDAQLAFPLRIEQIPVGLRQALLLNQLGVVGLHPDRKQRGRPLPMRRYRTWLQVVLHR